MLGIEAGGLVHVAAATLGLSALLVQSALAFTVVKYAGAAYLVYLGVRRFLERRRVPGGEGRAPRSRGRLFRQGMVVNVLNPKTALFFFAFLPQFIDPAAGTAALQIAVLGLLFIAMALVSDGIYALAAGAAAERLRRSPRFLGAERWFSGSVFVGLGVATAVSGHGRE
jgi:threonine/homoserine/homoserine lactone efflux protein